MPTRRVLTKCSRQRYQGHFHLGLPARPTSSDGRPARWNTARPGAWKSRPGFVELIENLALARDNAGGVVHVILAQARDKDAAPRSIARCFPQPNLKMRVVDLDEDEGTFVLERIDI